MVQTMKLVFGCDPNAQELKLQLMAHAQALGHEVTDYGSSDQVYANTAFRLAEAVAEGIFDRGILLCGTGIGVAIAANKVKGAYAACIHDAFQAQRAVLSNNANIITIGAQVVGVELAKCMLKEYLSCAFDSNSRSGVKVQRIKDYENGC